MTRNEQIASILLEAAELLKNSSNSDFLTSYKELENHIIKMYKSNKPNKNSVEMLQKLVNKESWNNNVWLAEIGSIDINNDIFVKCISKLKYGAQKEYAGYVKEWLTGSNDKYDIENKKALNLLEKLNLAIICKDGGGTEFCIDKNSNKIYLFDHDYGFIRVSISTSQFLSLCRKLV